jgi:hypothetical protein
MQNLISKQQRLIIEANKRGYYINPDGYAFNKQGKKLSLQKTNQNTPYLCIGIRFEGKVTRCFVHRLQAFQKYGELIFNEGIVVRHKNGISTDNSIQNILIGSQQDNCLDIPKENRILNASHPKYNHFNIIQDRLKGFSYKDLMQKYNILSKGTISFIINKSIKGKQKQFEKFK